MDEYQDTNTSQYELVKLLVGSRARFTVVGDDDQSIYRFRLADPTIFLDKYRRFKPWDQAAEGEERRLILSRNFRSRREILEAAKPRSAKELLDACDMIFCLDWACTDTRMRDLPAPAGMDGGVVFERHKALNWLVGAGEKADWDHVPVDT